MNEQLIKEHRQLSKRCYELMTQDNFEELQKLTPRINELYRLIDWGFKVGEVVERRTEHRWVEDVILGIENSQFRFYGVIMPPQLLRKKTEKLEQMELF